MSDQAFYQIRTVRASLPEPRGKDAFYRVRNATIAIKPGVDIELASWQMGRVEVYVYEGGLPMFACYLDEMNAQSRHVLNRLWRDCVRQLRAQDRRLIRKLQHYASRGWEMSYREQMAERGY